MGGAIIHGLISSRKYMDTRILVSDPRQDVLDTLKGKYPEIDTSTSNQNTTDADVLILAVKPLDYPDVISETGRNLKRDVIIVSIAAGITLEMLNGWLERFINEPAKIIRVMPNIPALISKGMTGLCPGFRATEQDMETVRQIFTVVGRTVVMPENLMDAYTALAGSSPAWVFMFIEALADGAVKEGIPRATAYTVAAQAVLGSAEMVLESGIHPGELKDRVCSPGGTTIEAVATLEKTGFRSAIIQAVEDCTRKCRELVNR